MPIYRYNYAPYPQPPYPYYPPPQFPVHPYDSGKQLSEINEVNVITDRQSN